MLRMRGGAKKGARVCVCVCVCRGGEEVQDGSGGGGGDSRGSSLEQHHKQDQGGGDTDNPWFFDQGAGCWVRARERHRREGSQPVHRYAAYLRTTPTAWLTRSLMPSLIKASMMLVSVSCSFSSCSRYLRVVGIHSFNGCKVARHSSREFTCSGWAELCRRGGPWLMGHQAEGWRKAVRIRVCVCVSCEEEERHERVQQSMRKWHVLIGDTTIAVDDLGLVRR